MIAPRRVAESRRLSTCNAASELPLVVPLVMPKSKRERKVTLSQTHKKGRTRKQSIIEEVRACADSYSSVYVFSAANMRNSALKDVRAKLLGSRLFFGRTKLLSTALGRSVADEHRDALSQVAQNLAGEAGLLFTDDSEVVVRRVLEEAEVDEFARAGAEATESIQLEAGPLTTFPHSMEPFLRKLGLPTRLDNGVVTLMCSHVVCTEGNELSADAAKILQLLGIKVARFKLTLKCRWEAPGSFQQFHEP